MLLDLRHAVIQVRELGDGHLVGQDRPPRPELNRLGLGLLSEIGDPINRFRGHAGQPADGLVDNPAPTRLDLAADFRVLCPAERRALGYPVLLRPRDDRLALRDRQGEIDFLKTADVFFHGAHHLMSYCERVGKFGLRF